MRRVGRFLFNILVSLDQLGNTLFGGDPDETISSRAVKAKHKGKRWGRWMCHGLDALSPGHCEMSEEPDQGENAVFPDPPKEK